MKIDWVYGAKIARDGAYGDFIVTFRDIDNAYSYGETQEEALANAKEALEEVLESMFDHGFVTPRTSGVKENEVGVTVSVRTRFHPRQS